MLYNVMRCHKIYQNVIKWHKIHQNTPKWIKIRVPTKNQNGWLSDTMQCSIFNSEHDGALDFSINRIIGVQEPIKVSVKVLWNSHFWQHWTQLCLEPISVYVTAYFCNANDGNKSLTKMLIFQKAPGLWILINWKIKNTSLF